MCYAKESDAKIGRLAEYGYGRIGMVSGFCFKIK